MCESVRVCVCVVCVCVCVCAVYTRVCVTRVCVVTPMCVNVCSALCVGGGGLSTPIRKC